MLTINHIFASETKEQCRELREAAHRQCVRNLLAPPGCTALMKTP